MERFRKKVQEKLITREIKDQGIDTRITVIIS